jgi:hypothetical protein
LVYPAAQRRLLRGVKRGDSGSGYLSYLQVSGEVISEFLQEVDVSILEGEQGTQSLARIYAFYGEKQSI